MYKINGNYEALKWDNLILVGFSYLNKYDSGELNQNRVD